MSKTFIASVLAAALTITSFSAAPARAELTDFEKFLLGAGALVIIGTAVHEQNKKAVKQRKAPKVTYHSPPRPKPTVKKKRKAAAIPGFCITRVQSHNGPRRILSRRCLQNNYRDVNLLPNRCRSFIEGPRGTRVGYRPKCLRKAGFQIARG